jgi:DNA-binding response OmpR family regulator
MHILIAEDDAALSNGLSRALRQSGYAVDCVPDGQQADTALVGDRFDLLILDLGLPLISGLEVLRRARARGARLPILILTASDGVNDRVRGLDLGADDYMVKPFDLPELEARIRALARRGLCGAAPTLQVGPLSMDPASRVAGINGKRLDWRGELAVPKCWSAAPDDWSIGDGRSPLRTRGGSQRERYRSLRASFAQKDRGLQRAHRYGSRAWLLSRSTKRQLKARDASCQAFKPAPRARSFVKSWNGCWRHWS